MGKKDGHVLCENDSLSGGLSVSESTVFSNSTFLKREKN